jgi:hypothetical protein
VKGFMGLFTGAFLVFVIVAHGIGILNGWGLLARKGFARVLTIILSVLALPGIPVGTALGIYGLWAMLQSGAAEAWAAYTAA